MLSFLIEHPALACGLRCPESQPNQHFRWVDIKYFRRLSFTKRDGSLTDATLSYLGGLAYELAVEADYHDTYFVLFLNL
jgi:hypothetical protein